jgi:hypothetical protein
MFEQFDEDYNPNTSIQSYDEDDVPAITSIYSGLSQIIVPQSGKKGSSYSDRFKKIADTKRDPIAENFWETVNPTARTLAKQLVEDVITVQKREGGITLENFEFLVVYAIPMTTYTTWVKRPDNRNPGKFFNTRQGGKGMWKTDANGNQIMGAEAQVVCMSHDGLAPNVNFVGTNEPFRKEVNAPYHTGLKRNIAIGESCDSCPFQDWAAYNGGKPQCGNQYKELFYLPTQVDMHGQVMKARLAWIGGSLSVQKALEGQKAGNAYGHKFKSLPSFEKLIQPTKEREVLAAANEFDMSNAAVVVGFAKGTEQIEHYRGINYVPVKKGSLKSEDEVLAKAVEIKSSGKLDEITHIAYMQQEFAFAPNGVNGNIQPFALMVVQNNHEKFPQRIPFIAVRTDDDKFFTDALNDFERDEFLSFLREAAERRQLWKDQRESNARQVHEKLHNPQPVVSEVPVEILPESIPTDD